MAKAKSIKNDEKPVISPFRIWADAPDKAAISELCQYIAEGGHLAGFCKSKEFAYVTVLDWIHVDKSVGGRSEMYAHAREDRADVLADEIIAIADDGRNDTYVDDEGKVRTDQEVIARSKLRVDARKWAASKLKPRSYGEKMAVTDGDGKPLNSAPPVFNITMKS